MNPRKPLPCSLVVFGASCVLFMFAIFGFFISCVMFAGPWTSNNSCLAHQNREQCLSNCGCGWCWSNSTGVCLNGDCNRDHFDDDSDCSDWRIGVIYSVSVFSALILVTVIVCLISLTIFFRLDLKIIGRFSRPLFI